MATRASYDKRGKEMSNNKWWRGRWSRQQSQRRGRMNVSSDSGSRNNNCDSWGNNSKLLNHMSDFQRNSAFRLRSYIENSINKDNRKWTGTLDSCMHKLLTLITSNICVNLECFLLRIFISVIYVDVLLLNIISKV